APGVAAAADPILRDLAERLISRRLFKTVELGHDPTVIDRVREPVLAIARARFGDAAQHYVRIDHTTQVPYRATGDEELWVIGHPRHDRVTLGELLEALPLGRPRSTVRLVCAPELLEDLRPLAEA